MILHLNFPSGLAVRLDSAWVTRQPCHQNGKTITPRRANECKPSLVSIVELW